MTEQNCEKVGNITLDLTNYGGEDLYSDGPIEDDMLAIVEKHSEDELNGIIKDNFSWPYLYHFSSIRQNVIRWLPITKEHTVLEIGAGCGAITGGLATMAKHVTCIELSKKRSLINANRNKQFDNVEIKVGNFTDVEPNLTEQYDFITLIGVFEYAECYIQSNKPYHDFLECIRKHLKPNGKIVIAIENRLGMKYLAGCKEDHTARIGEGLDYYPVTKGVKTFDKREINEIFNEVGFKNNRFYYPYPDYKLPLEIYSDEWLPKRGTLRNNQNNLDQSRLKIFDEATAFDKAIELGMFDEVSNSYIVILKLNAEEQEISDASLTPIFAKFSNDRNTRYSIQTQIVKYSENGNLYIRKLPLSVNSMAHIEQLKENECILQNAFQYTRFVPNKTVYIEDEMCFDYLQGKCMDDALDELLYGNKIEAFYELLDCFISEVKKSSVEYLNVDFITSNVYIDKEDEKLWHVIDYEWLFKKDDCPLDLEQDRYDDFITYRILHYFIDVDLKRQSSINRNELFEHYGINLEKCKLFYEVERTFQEQLDNGYYKLSTAKYEHYKPIIDVNYAMSVLDGKAWELQIQVIFEDDSVDIYNKSVDEFNTNQIALALSFDKAVKKISLCRPGGRFVYGLYDFVVITEDISENYDCCYKGDVKIGFEKVLLENTEAITLDFTKSEEKKLASNSRIELKLQDFPIGNEMSHVIDLKNEEIRQQNEYMAGLKENIKALETIISSMEQSTSWKITKPLRGIRKDGRK